MHGMNNITLFILYPAAQLPYPGLNCLTVGASRSHTHTFGRVPVDEGSARRRDLYLTTHNTHKRQTSMPPTRLEPTIPVDDRPQTLALDRAATAIGILFDYLVHIENVDEPFTD